MTTLWAKAEMMKRAQMAVCVSAFLAGTEGAG